MHYYLGLPMWSNKSWCGRFFTADAKSDEWLSQYARVFNTVEGNTSFYALPSVEKIARWKNQVPKSFCFCFKFPRRITHDLKLQDCQRECGEFFQRIAPLHEQLGPLHIQLPADFSPAELPQLKKFLSALPLIYSYALEVRNPGFYGQSDAAEELQALLQHLRINRVMFDSTALFASIANDAATLDAKTKKPQLPVEPTATSTRPVVRFVGQMDLATSEIYLRPWAAQFSQWMQQGKTPMMYIHTPDNQQSWLLAARFHTALQQQLPLLPDLPRWPNDKVSANGQLDLF